MFQNNDDLCTCSKDPFRSKPFFHGLTQTAFPNWVFIWKTTIIIKNKTIIKSQVLHVF